MFKILTLFDTVDVPPYQFDPNKMTAAVIRTLKKRYLNRVIENQGLVVMFYQYLQSERAVVQPHNGGLSFRVKFRLVLFRPDHNQVLRGWVQEITEAKGIRVTLGFFNEIYIPREACPKGGQFKPDQNGDLAILCPCYDWLREKDPAAADKEWWVVVGDYIQFTVSYVSFDAKKRSPLYVKGDMQCVHSVPLKWVDKELEKIVVPESVKEDVEYEDDE